MGLFPPSTAKSTSAGDPGLPFCAFLHGLVRVFSEFSHPRRGPLHFLFVARYAQPPSSSLLLSGDSFAPTAPRYMNPLLQSSTKDSRHRARSGLRQPFFPRCSSALADSLREDPPDPPLKGTPNAVVYSRLAQRLPMALIFLYCDFLFPSVGRAAVSPLNPPARF